MTVNWRTRDAVFLVLAATYADLEENVCDDAWKFNGRFPAIAKLCGDEVTYYALKNFFKEVAAKAYQLRADRDRRYGSIGPAKSQSTRTARRGPRGSNVLEPDDIQAMEEAVEILGGLIHPQPTKRFRFSLIDPGTPSADEDVETRTREILVAPQAQAGVSSSNIKANSTDAEPLQFSSLERMSNSSEAAIVAKIPAVESKTAPQGAEAPRSLENTEDRKQVGPSESATGARRHHAVPMSDQYPEGDAAVRANEIGMHQKMPQGPLRTSKTIQPGSFLLPESRECALCDVYFKGMKAFEKHESMSELHRRNLQDDELVARAELEIQRRHIEPPAPAKFALSCDQNEGTNPKVQQNDTVTAVEPARPLRNTMPPPPPPPVSGRFVASEKTIIDLSGMEKGKMRATTPLKGPLEKLRGLYPTLPEQRLRRMHEMASPAAVRGLVSTPPKRKRRWYEELNERTPNQSADIETLPSSDDDMVPSNCDDAGDSDYYYSESA